MLTYSDLKKIYQIVMIRFTKLPKSYTQFSHAYRMWQHNLVLQFYSCGASIGLFELSQKAQHAFSKPTAEFLNYQKK